LKGIRLILRELASINSPLSPGTPGYPRGPIAPGNPVSPGLPYKVHNTFLSHVEIIYSF